MPPHFQHEPAQAQLDAIPFCPITSYLLEEADQELNILWPLLRLMHANVRCPQS